MSIGPVELILIITFVIGLPLMAAVGIFLLIRSVRSREQASNMKKCPFCAEYIKQEALVCRYCGRDQPQKS